MNSYLNIASANSGPTNLESMDMDTNLDSLSVVPRNASSLANKLRVMSPDVAASRFSTRIAIRAKRKILLINPADVIAVEAQGNYVLVRQTSSSHLLRESISTMEEKLAPHGFVRIHRSVLVNRACVEEIHAVIKIAMARAVDLGSASLWALRLILRPDCRACATSCVGFKAATMVPTSMVHEPPTNARR